MLSEQKLDSIHDALDQRWSLDAIARRDKLMNVTRYMTAILNLRRVRNMDMLKAI